MALVERALGVSVKLESGGFSEGGNSANLPDGLKMIAYVEHAGGLSDGTLDLTIYGMTRSLMNQLSTLGMQINLVPKNLITLTAGEPGKMSTAFIGYIIAAYADFNASPDVAFHITAHTLGPFGAQPLEPSSFKGSADVATVMSGFATKMGLRFENNGVTAKLQNQYYSGSVRTQAQARASRPRAFRGITARAAFSRSGRRTARATTGRFRRSRRLRDGSMIGYPTYTAYGIMLRSLYDPTIGFGQKIQVQSSVLTTGEWAVYGLSHHLESQTPNGKWETEILAYNPKHPTPVR
jgi:hypothetical protein